MPTFKDYPLKECVEACEKIVAEGGTVYQKWTCDGCGGRITGNNPNTFTLKGHCEDCDFTTDLLVKGCNYLVMYSV
jgi:hypothetical protein